MSIQNTACHICGAPKDGHTHQCGAAETQAPTPDTDAAYAEVWADPSRGWRRPVEEFYARVQSIERQRDQSDKIAATANTEAVRYMREREDAKAALALAVKILTDSEYEWRTKLAAANASLTECAQKNAALMKAIEILKPDPDEAKEVEQMRDLLRRADRQLAGQGFGEQWPLRLAIKKALSVAPYQGRFGESEPPSSTGRCTCDGCDKTVGNAWRDSDGYHCLTCLAKQRDEARAEVARLREDRDLEKRWRKDSDDRATDFEAEVARLADELERERMRLAACGVVALSNTPESAAKQRDMHPVYMSASCHDVMGAVDREMQHRAEVARLQEIATALRDCLPEFGVSPIERKAIAAFEKVKDAK
jgi:hypothetical protein